MPKRIVSLVPSLSQTLVEWGLRSELVGCTQFCVLPPDLHRTAQIVGGTKDFSLAAIRGLSATHIIANQEENPREAVLELAEERSVLVTFPRGPADVPQMMRDIGHFLEVPVLAEAAAREVEIGLDKLTHLAVESRRYLYLIWRDPYMLAGPDTYISRLLAHGGWTNAYTGPERYPSLSLEAMRECRPTHIFLSSEPYPFRQRDALRLREQWKEAPPLFKVDGRLLSWYGSSTIEALRALEENPGIIAGKLGQAC